VERRLVLLRILADLVVVAHLTFIIFVVVGGLLALKWRRVIWVHLPVVAYGILIEFLGWVCPLTPFENWLRRLAGQSGYDETFTEHYILPAIYPSGLTYKLQITLGVAVFVINAAVYAWLIVRARREA